MKLRTRPRTEIDLRGKAEAVIIQTEHATIQVHNRNGLARITSPEGLLVINPIAGNAIEVTTE